MPIAHHFRLVAMLMGRQGARGFVIYAALALFSRRRRRFAIVRAALIQPMSRTFDMIPRHIDILTAAASPRRIVFIDHYYFRAFLLGGAQNTSRE